MLKKTITLGLIIVLGFSLSGCNLLSRIQEAFGLQETETEKKIPQETATPEATLVPTAIPEASPAEESIETQLKKAFSLKFGNPVSDVNLTISKETPTHASGVVSFGGEMGGGWWLAAKVASTWKLVADGNGTVMCDYVEPYGFPTSMVPECWDEATETLKTF